MPEKKVNIKFEDKRGSVVVLVAAAMFVLLGFVAMVTDIGLLYLTRTRLANAADAAALAGAQELPVDPQRAASVAEEYAESNGVRPEEVGIGVAPDCRSVTVEARRAVDFIFARALGIVKGRVRAAATAAVYPLAGARGVVPFSIEEQELVFGRQYVLKEGAGCGSATLGDDGRMYGWFGALDLGGKGDGASEYRDNVINGCSSMVRVGDVIDVETGNMSGPTADGVLCRIARCQDGCTFESFRRDCPRLVIVPVVRYLGVSGDKKKVEVRGFAAFFLEGVEGRGRDNNVVGRFVRTVYPGEAGDALDYGVEVVKLVR
ncbi:MAG: pilus assembly protein TadG-related protein [Thermacetogeniaceae bacterium]